MIQRLRLELPLEQLLFIAQLPRATYYYHVKRYTIPDKYEDVKAAITAIYHEYRGRYGYRRIATQLRQQGFFLNHKTVQNLIKMLDRAFAKIPDRTNLILHSD